MEFIKKHLTLLIAIGGLLVLICFALLLIPESQLPTVLQSSGLVAIISAFLGVIMTVAVTAILLDKQSETQKVLIKEQSEADAQKDKDAKIYDQKIKVYSEFTSKMWGLFSNMDMDSREKLEKYDELRGMCFDKLVFFLSSKRIKELTVVFEKITKNIKDFDHNSLCEITDILKRSLDDEKEKEKPNEDYLAKFYDAFEKDIVVQEEAKPNIPATQNQNTIREQQQVTSEIQYWHFNILIEEQQIEAFKSDNWVLALIEYGEDWRTNLIRQVKPNDVIFLFKRGGAGYIGAFRALNPPAKILETETTYSDAEYAKYDIYDGIDDGATLASNILVEPIAYNFKGVGYYTVRRRTIERMNDTEAVKFLLNRFNGNDLDDNRLDGKGKFDDGKTVSLNNNYFSEIISKYNR